MIFTEEPPVRRGLKIRDANFHRYTWGYIASAAITVVGGAISSNQAKKKAGAGVPYQNVDVQEQQRNAIAGNMASQSSIEALLSRSNNFSADQALSLEDKTMPGFANLRGKLAETSTSLLDNPYELPKDVQDNLGRLAAERGIGAGTRGQFNEFSLLRDFGINSLQYGQQRIGQAQGIAGLLSSISPKVNPMSPLAFYVSPQENAAAATNNNSNNQSIAQDAQNNQARISAQANSDMWSNLSQLAGAGLAAYSNRKPAAKEGVGSGGAPANSGISDGFYGI